MKGYTYPADSTYDHQRPGTTPLFAVPDVMVGMGIGVKSMAL
ncbi:hypothetical protein [Methylobacterium sp. W2]|nr:hypothetical protein [Methylobacterium sp. W2]